MPRSTQFNIDLQHVGRRLAVFPILLLMMMPWLPLMKVAAMDPAIPPVTALAFSPDGDSVISGSQSGVMIHSWPDLKPAKTLPIEFPNVHDLRYSPDGKGLAVAGGHPGEDGIVAIFSWPAGERTGTLDGHFDAVTNVRWLDNQRVVSASLDHRLITWDLPSGKPIRILEGHARGITSLETIPDENLIASGGLDHSLRIWSADEDKAVRNLSIHARPINGLALRTTGEGLPLLASASDDQTVRFWQPTIGRMVRFARLPSIPREIIWTDDGDSVVACCDDGKVYRINPQTVNVSQGRTAVIGWANAIALHPSQELAVVGGVEGQLVKVRLPE